MWRHSANTVHNSSRSRRDFSEQDIGMRSHRRRARLRSAVTVLRNAMYSTQSEARSKPRPHIRSYRILDDLLAASFVLTTPSTSRPLLRGRGVGLRLSKGRSTSRGSEHSAETAQARLHLKTHRFGRPRRASLVRRSGWIIRSLSKWALGRRCRLSPHGQYWVLTVFAAG